MKNKTKTAKTILFASLIAAMILPFGGMNFAVAEETANTETVKADAQKIAKKILKVQEKISNVEASLEDATDDEQVSQLEARLAKLEARLAKLEQKLTEKMNELSQAASGAVDAPTKEQTAGSTGRGASGLSSSE